MKKKLRKALSFLFKAFIVLFILLSLANSFFNTSDITAWLSIVYHGILLITGILSALWLFIRFNRILYALSTVFFLLYIGMSNFHPEIKEQRDWGDCASRGRVWDRDEKRCRSDCFTWTEEKGCIPPQYH